MRLSRFALVTLIASPLTAQISPYGKGLPVPGRSVVTTTHGIVATSQPLASAAGAAVLARGGTAVDAAIAANAVLGVVEPMMNGIGGDLFAIIYEAKTGKLHGLNASGWAPTGMTADLVRSKSETGRMPQRGVWSVTVPGAVAGWGAMHDKFGRLPLSDVLLPAIQYANNGAPIHEVTAGMWAGAEGMSYANAEFKRVFTPSGKTPGAGVVFKNPDLAASLGRIAAMGARGFYTGPTAQSILQTVNALGSPMTAADLAEFTPEWVTPLSTRYRDWTVYELPPNGQGLAALEMLNIMSRYPIKEYGWASAKAMHVEIEAKKLAYADLLKYIGDPKFSKQPVAQLLSPEHAARRAALIDPAKANCKVPPAELNGLESGGSETIYLSVVDGDGNIVSLIQSNYSSFGSGLVAPGTGFALHNRGGLFTLEPNQPNTIAPRHRPLHTIIPAFMEKGDLKMGFGIMGGWNQSQAHAQFVSNIADFGMNIQQAMEASRFTKLSFDGCDVQVEASLPAETLEGLKALGHQPAVEVPRYLSTFGFGQAVMTNGAGVHFAASDPRHDGAAIPEAPAGQWSTDISLVLEIGRADSALFAAYNRHDADALMRGFSDDLEFFHDQGGLQHWKEVSAGFHQLLGGNSTMHRELVPGTMRVYPVAGYGAMQMGRHRFCHVENGKDDCGTFDFLMIWKKVGNRWVISRVASWGH